MRISSAKLVNFKGITDEYKLAPLVMIFGPNCSGKTAISTAIKLALSGALPVFGKAPRSIYRLAGNPTAAGRMEVTVTTDPPGAITHVWTRSENGTVSYSGSIPPDLQWPDSFLDFRRFLSLPAADQAREMFARCVTKSTPDDYLHRLDSVTVDGGTTDREAIDEIRGCLIDLKDRYTSLAGWIDATLAWFKGRVSQEGTDEKLARSTLRGHLAAQPDRGEDVSEKIADVQKRLQKATASIAKQMNAWRAYEKAKTAYDAFEATRASRESEVQAVYRRRMGEIERRRALAMSRDTCPTCGAKNPSIRQKALAEVDREEKGVEQDFATALSEIKKVVAPIKPTKPEATSKDVQQAIQALQSELAALTSTQNAFESSSAWRQTRDRLEQKTVACMRRLETTKACQKMLREWQESLINSGVGGAIKVANQFTDGLLDAPLSYNSELQEFGRWAPGGKGWISLDAFSGFEEQVAFAALSVAIASQVKIKLVIMDEMGRMTGDHKVAVVRRMSSLVKDGVIDQFIGLDVSVNDYRTVEALPGLQFIRV